MEVIVDDEALFLWMNLSDGGVHWCFSILQVLEGKWVWYEVCDGSNCWSMVEDGNGRVCGVRFGFMNKWSYWWPIATQIFREFVCSIWCCYFYIVVQWGITCVMQDLYRAWLD